MAGKWWNYSWNPTTGCTPVSAGCLHCWAKNWTERFIEAFEPNLTFKPTAHEDRLQLPHWRKPKRVAVCLMGDLFHESIPEEFIIKVILEAHSHSAPTNNFFFLTKRVERMVDIVGRMEWETIDVPENLFFGVSVEDKKSAKERLYDLNNLYRPFPMNRGEKIWISAEPLLEDITEEVRPYLKRLSWVVAGPETGPGARPCPPTDLGGACQEKNIPFWWKGPSNHRGLPRGVK